MTTTTSVSDAVVERARKRNEEEIRRIAKETFGDGDQDPKILKQIEDIVIKSKSFNINYHCLQLMHQDPFFCRISQNVRKIATFQLPTAAMAFKNDEFTMFFNPLFMASLDEEEVKGVLTHEFYHLILGHINLRRRDNMRLWNIATDLAINSLIVKGGKKLPEQGLMPGKKPKPPPAHVKMGPEEREANEKFCDFIASLPGEKASEWYYSAILKFCEENNIPTSGSCAACAAGVPKQSPASSQSQKGDNDGGKEDKQGKGKGSGKNQDQKENGGEKGQNQGSGQGHQHGHGQPQHTCGGVAGVGTMDDHDGWEDGDSEASREYVDAKIRKVIGEAVKQADQSNGWGSVPAEMQGYLRERYSNQVNWKQLLRQFTGLARGTTRISSLKVINRRYPYVHPGVKRGRTANLWIFVDQSGSVDDRSLELLFGELNNLARQMDIKVFPFDTQVDSENVINWRRGQKVQPKRTRCGGTSFDAVVNYLDKHRGECDGALILSDGECGQPPPAPVRFGYIVVPNRELLFKPRENEIHIQMKDENPNGNW